MKTKQFVVMGLIFALFIALGLMGGSWTSSSAKGTVPKTPPGWTHLPTRNPHYTLPGANCTRQELNRVGEVSLCIVDTAPEKDFQVNIELIDPIPAPKQNKTFTSAFKVSVLDTAQGALIRQLSAAATIHVALPSEILDQFKKNPTASLMWYNPQKQSWEKIASTVVNGMLSARVQSTGLFIIAMPR